MAGIGNRNQVIAALVAGGVLALWGGGAARPAAAQDAPAGDALFAFHITADSPVGRTFAFKTATAGAPPSGMAAASGAFEVCAGGPEEGGRVLVLFDDDSAVDANQSGCQTVELTGATSVTLQAQRGDWDVVIRRPAAGAAETALVAQVTSRNSFGIGLSLMTAPATPAGTPPSTAPYSGTVEVCATGSGALGVFIDDALSLKLTAAGCQTTAVSGAGSLTLMAQNGAWDVAVRRLG